jgi:hypothetical protein
MKHVVALSGGKDSTAMALRLREVYLDRAFIFVCTPTGNELPAMERHWRDLEQRLGAPLERVQPYGDRDGLEHLIREQKRFPNHRQRWCTRMLKVTPILHWLKAHTPCTYYVGFRADEPLRDGIYTGLDGLTQAFPMRDWGWDVNAVKGYLASAGVTVPQRTDCAWCYGQRLAEWKRLADNHPEFYNHGAALEHELGGTFRTPGRDTWPLSLDELREAFKTRKLRQSAQEFDGCAVCRK